MKNALLVALTLCGLLAAAAPAGAHVPDPDGGPPRVDPDAGLGDDAGLTPKGGGNGSGGAGGDATPSASDGGCAVGGRGALPPAPWPAALVGLVALAGLRRGRRTAAP